MTTDTSSSGAASPSSRPPFLVRRRTVFTWIIPLFLLAAAWIWHPHGSVVVWAVGVAFVVLGEVVRFWAAGYISKDSVIATGGPYGFVRNPLYFGSLLLSVGYGLVSGFGWVGVLILVALYLLFHLAAIFYEEGFLKKKFGAPYEAYLKTVPRLIPSLWPKTTGLGSFSWQQAVKNREPVSAAFAFVFTALLSVRYLIHH